MTWHGPALLYHNLGCSRSRVVFVIGNEFVYVKGEMKFGVSAYCVLQYIHNCKYMEYIQQYI